MRNYLARLGWSHGDDEIFDDAQAIDWFDIKDINRAPSRLDFAKLGSVNAHWIRVADDDRLVELVATGLHRHGHVDDAATRAVLARVIPQVKERAQTLVQLTEACQFALAKGPFTLDEKTRNLLTEETRARLLRLHEFVLTWPDWHNDAIDGNLKQFVENEGIGFGKIGPVLRGILSGGHTAPDISRTLAALGQTESLSRLNEALFI